MLIPHQVWSRFPFAPKCHPNEYRKGCTYLLWFVLLVSVSCVRVAPKAEEGRVVLRPPKPQSAPKFASVYVVRRGDTLTAIARRYAVEVKELVRRNSLTNAHQIYVGQKLKVPQTPSVPERPSLTREPRKPRPPPIQRRPSTRPQPSACGAHGDAPRDWSRSERGFLWPTDGVVLNAFGRLNGRRYDGIAIGAPRGTPVWASQRGEVILSDYQKGYGQLVVVRHDNGLLTLYGSLERICVREGRRLKAGQLVGLVGMSSGVASPRLYFEVRRGDQTSINPRLVLP